MSSAVRFRSSCVESRSEPESPATSRRRRASRRPFARKQPPRRRPLRNTSTRASPSCSQTLRRNDNVPARFGGDEFVLSLAAIEHPSEAEALGARIVQLPSEPYIFGDVNSTWARASGSRSSSMTVTMPRPCCKARTERSTERRPTARTDRNQLTPHGGLRELG